MRGICKLLLMPLKLILQYVVPVKPHIALNPIEKSLKASWTLIKGHTHPLVSKKNQSVGAFLCSFSRNGFLCSIILYMLEGRC